MSKAIYCPNFGLFAPNFANCVSDFCRHSKDRYLIEVLQWYSEIIFIKGSEWSLRPQDVVARAAQCVRVCFLAGFMICEGPRRIRVVRAVYVKQWAIRQELSGSRRTARGPRGTVPWGPSRASCTRTCRHRRCYRTITTRKPSCPPLAIKWYTPSQRTGTCQFSLTAETFELFIHDSLVHCHYDFLSCTCKLCFQINAMYLINIK